MDGQETRRGRCSATSDHAVSRGRRGDKEQREVEEDYLFALPDGAPVQLYLPNIVNLVLNVAHVASLDGEKEIS